LTLIKQTKFLICDSSGKFQNDLDDQDLMLATVLFRTWNLGQHFLDISKKIYVNQSLVAIIENHFKIFLVHQKSRKMALSSQKFGYVQ
jgi:hypothetical protein